MMQTPNILETPEYPKLPECENVSVGSIRRHELDAAWLAGIIDGEGCIHTTYANGKKSKSHYRCRVEVRNTNPFMVQRITQILANREIQFFIHFLKKKESYKEGLVVVVTGYKAIQRLLQMVLPHLTAKYDEARLMAEFIDWRLNEHPMVGCNGGERMEVLREHYLELHHGLRALKRRSFGLQRLPRGGSCALDLSKLEIQESVV
jgi:hypothetical protein